MRCMHAKAGMSILRNLIAIALFLALAAMQAQALSTGTTVYFNVMTDIPPQTAFAAPTPTNGTYYTDQTINVTAYDVNLANVTIFVNGAAARTCNSSPCEYILHGEGNYTFYAVAIDAGGKTNATENRTISIETAPPSVGGGGGGGGTTPTKICIEDWSCGEWSPCLNGRSTRQCTDRNACGTEYMKPFTDTPCYEYCTPDWQCTEWAACTAQGTQNRTCTDLNDCRMLRGKPTTAQQCLHHCSDGEQDSNETGIDCGGECEACPTEEMPRAAAITVRPYDTNILCLLIPVLVVILAVLLLLLRGAKPPPRWTRIFSIANALFMAACVALMMPFTRCPAGICMAIAKKFDMNTEITIFIVVTVAIALIESTVYVFAVLRKDITRIRAARAKPKKQSEENSEKKLILAMLMIVVSLIVSFTYIMIATYFPGAAGQTPGGAMAAVPTGLIWLQLFLVGLLLVLLVRWALKSTPEKREKRPPSPKT